jgi:hypothetical protein
VRPLPQQRPSCRQRANGRKVGIKNNYENENKTGGINTMENRKQENFTKIKYRAR